MKKQESVFETYAHEYDLITNAAQREIYHTKEVRAVIDRFQPERVLDAGCATGLTAMLFARAGVTAVGLDKSRPMLTQAAKKYADQDLPLSFQLGQFEKLPKKLHSRFELVVCLANSISGVETLSGLRRSMKSFYDVLVPDGSLVLQMLNYKAVKADTLLPIKATHNDGLVYERFSERRGRSLFVYVTRADFGQSPPQFEIFRHEFDNFEPEQVLTALEGAGFKNIRKFANLHFTKRFSKTSRDLVITADRPAGK